MPKQIELAAFSLTPNDDGTYNEILADDKDGVDYPERNFVLPKSYPISDKPGHFLSTTAAINAAKTDAEFYAKFINDVRFRVLVNGVPLDDYHIQNDIAADSFRKKVKGTRRDPYAGFTAEQLADMLFNDVVIEAAGEDIDEMPVIVARKKVG